MTDDSLYRQAKALRSAVTMEVPALLDWWIRFMPDRKRGFHGSIDNLNRVVARTPRGLVLNSRILWTFAAAYEWDPKQEYLDMAYRAFRYGALSFEDPDYGGMYWSVDENGVPLETKKQVYGLAFWIYGLSEFCRVARYELPGEKARQLFFLLEKCCHDKERGGYFEAFSRDWKPLADLRLSEKDANEKKSMNTHLHVLEAYTNLYRIWKDKTLANAIRSLLQVFCQHIIDPEKFRQGLFFSEDWVLRSAVVSFGHDIEASWLLYEAAAILGDENLLSFYRKVCVSMAETAMQGLDADGALWYELDTATGNYNKEKHWWPQAEAMVGFLNACQLSGNEQYFICADRSWNFICRELKDYKNGEWFWGIGENGVVMEKEKAGFWKCPYHNVRACLEVSKRITESGRLITL